MKKHHYVYSSYEEWGREYIGVRSCDCMPEEDTKYFGSFRDKTFFPTEKTILFVCETREEAMGIEIELHDFFDVAVNPQFANKSKQTSTGFDRTGLQSGEKNPMYGRIGENHPNYGVPCTEEIKKKISAANSGKTRTEETKKKISESKSGENHPRFGLFGALNPCSKAIIAIKPDGTELHFGSGHEAARELGIDPSHLCKYSKTGQVLKWGKFEGWQFIYKNSTNF